MSQFEKLDLAAELKVIGGMPAKAANHANSAKPEPASQETLASLAGLAGQLGGTFQDDQAVLAALLQGKTLRVHSSTLGELVYWVRDEEIKAQLRDESQRNRAYTLEEIRWMLTSNWTARELQCAHQIKRELGGRLIPEVSSVKLTIKPRKY